MTLEEHVKTATEALLFTGSTAIRFGLAVTPMAVSVYGEDGALEQAVMLIESVEDRWRALAALVRRTPGARALLFMADANLQRFTPDDPCPFCLGEEPEVRTCDYCKRTGDTPIAGATTEGLVVHILWKEGLRHDSVTQPYRRRKAGGPVFGEPEEIRCTDGEADLAKVWEMAGRR
jgi:hypothetical protein